MPSPYTEDDARAYLALVERWTRSDERRCFAIADATSDEVLGAIDVRPGAGGSDVGYWVAPWARGRGIATRALRLVCAWAFDTSPVGSLELETHPENTASRRVAERAGFRYLETVTSDQAFSDGTRERLRFRIDRPAA